MSLIGLRARAVLTVIAIVVLSVIGSTIPTMLRTNELVEAQELRSLENLASGLGVALELPIAVGDRDEVHRLLGQFTNVNDRLGYVAVLDADRTPVAFQGSRFATADSYSADAWPAELWFTNETPILDTLSFVGAGEGGLFPGVDADAEPADGGTPAVLGYVVLGSPRSIVTRAQLAQLRVSVLTTGTVIALVVPLTYIIVGRWTSRLGALIRASASISKADYGVELDRGPDDEIGRVIMAFDQMRISIRDRDATERQHQRELREARERADKASAAKSQFLAHMSHEIRTPLNGVVGMLDLLGMTQLDQRQLRHIQTAKSSADALLALINDILDFSKIEAGRIELDRVDFEIRDLFESVAEMVAPRASEKGVELICHIDPEVPRAVVGDPGKTRQVLINLATNAVKFTDSGEIVIRLQAVSRQGNRWTLRASVSDTGIGIPEDRRDRLFKSFSQVDASTTRRYGGTGLGLAISKGLVEALGGEIGVVPDRARGSEFYFMFPVEEGRRQPDPRSETGVPLRGARAMVVDDNATNREIYTTALRRWGVRVESYERGGEGIEALRDAGEDSPFDLLLLDMRMPEMDGVQFAERMHSESGIRAPKVLMLTSMLHDAMQTDLDSIGIDTCLHKPVRLSVLYNTLVELLGGHATTRAETETADAADTASLAGLGLIVAEDNEINQLVIREILQAAGITVEIAVNGEELLSRYDASRHRAILMDCEMPVIDGLEATRRLRQAEADAGEGRVPVIALTANAIDGDRERCLNAGMDDYLTKPIDPGLLMQTLRKWCLTEKGNAAGPRVAAASGGLSSGKPLVPGAGTPGADHGFSIDSAIARCGGNASVYGEVLRAFGESLGAAGERIEDALASEAHDRVAREAHSVKGAALNVGDGRLASIAKELEDAAKSGPVAVDDEVLVRFRAGLAASLAEIPRLIDSLRSAA